VLGEVGIEILAPVPSSARGQLDTPWPDAARSPAVQRSSSDTQAAVDRVLLALRAAYVAQIEPLLGE
jgi:hypothetical protein